MMHGYQLVCFLKALEMPCKPTNSNVDNSLISTFAWRGLFLKSVLWVPAYVRSPVSNDFLSRSLRNIKLGKYFLDEL
jgi:hypothetical protein